MKNENHKKKKKKHLTIRFTGDRNRERIIQLFLQQLSFTLDGDYKCRFQPINS